MAKTVFEKAFLQKDINALLVLNLEKLGQSIDNLLWKQAMEHDLSTLQIRLLLLIRYGHESINASQLAIQLHLSKATVSVALKPLIEKKFIVKRKSATDSRIAELKLTDWGQEIVHVAGFYLEPLYQLILPIDKMEKEMMLKNISGILGKLDSKANK